MHPEGPSALGTKAAREDMPSHWVVSLSWAHSALWCLQARSAPVSLCRAPAQCDAGDISAILGLSSFPCKSGIWEEGGKRKPWICAQTWPQVMERKQVWGARQTWFGSQLCRGQVIFGWCLSESLSVPSVKWEHGCLPYRAVVGIIGG